MASDVSIKFVPRPGSSPASGTPKNYTLMEVGGVTYLVTDMVGGKAQEHTEAVWKTKADDMKKLFNQLQTDNDGDFSPEFISHVRVETAQNRVTYNKRTDQLAPPTVAKLKNPQILRSFGCNPYVPFTHPGLIETKKGNCNQSTSPIAQANPDARSACTYIVAELAQKVIGASAPLNIDDVIKGGQEKYIRAGLKGRHVNVAEIDLENDGFNDVEKGRGITLDIPQDQTAEYYKQQLDQLSQNEALCVAALTNRGETVGLIIERDMETEAIKQIIYFDSHGNQANDADGKACLKYFNSSEAAGAFLAHRIPYQPVSNNPDWNKISLTPLLSVADG